jgi:hypothetical protein
MDSLTDFIQDAFIWAFKFYLLGLSFMFIVGGFMAFFMSWGFTPRELYNLAVSMPVNRWNDPDNPKWLNMAVVPGDIAIALLVFFGGLIRYMTIEPIMWWLLADKKEKGK